MKKLIHTCTAALFAAVLSHTAMAQSGNALQPNQAKGILGYLDPATGSFRPVSQAALPQDESVAAAIAATTGKFVFSFSITIASSIPLSQSIVCGVTSDVTETNTTTFQSSVFDEEASAVASRSGSTATCTVTVPYSWLLATPASDTVSLRYTIGAGTVASLTINAVRLSSHNLPSIKVPATGSTTTETIKATI